jgi:hypothetical protein
MKNPKFVYCKICGKFIGDLTAFRDGAMGEIFNAYCRDCISRILMDEGQRKRLRRRVFPRQAKLPF